MSTLVQRFTNVRRDEVAPLLAAAFYFFCILTALMVLRPAREALGMQRGIEAIRWLFMGTLVVTLLVNPLFGWLVSRFRRLFFITATYLFFIACLLGFYALLVGAPQAVGETTGQVFYVWFSVFNLFVTMVFWALMADRFSLEQSKRFFAVIAAGGRWGRSSDRGSPRSWRSRSAPPPCCWSPRASSCWERRRPGSSRGSSRSAPTPRPRPTRSAPRRWTSGR
jgi:ATP:ADP antiporter, AAA family